MGEEVINMGNIRVVLPYCDLIITKETFASLITVQGISAGSDVLSFVVLVDDQAVSVGIVSDSDEATGEF